jgi:hypothetical protein
MPPKRSCDHILDSSPHELPPHKPDAGRHHPTLLQTVYDDLRAARAQLYSEQARNQSLEVQMLELNERANRLHAGSALKEAENARLRTEIARLQSHPPPSPLSARAPPPDDRDVYVFKLEKAAKSSGGDKFVCERQPEFNVYFPQTISRQDAAAPCQFLQLRVERPMPPSRTPPSSLLQQRSDTSVPVGSLLQQRSDASMPVGVSGVKKEIFKREVSSDDQPLVLDFNGSASAADRPKLCSLPIS